MRVIVQIPKFRGEEHKLTIRSFQIDLRNDCLI